MMSVSLYLNDGTLIKHYSNAGYLLLQNETGNKYADPIDLVPYIYAYTETDELIDGEEAPAEEELVDIFKEIK